MPERFDAIVVGAGLSGLAAAYTMASKGARVAVIERGDFPGGKNVMGGVLYRQPTAEVFPDFWKDAPLERPIVAQNGWLLSEDGSAMMAGHRSGPWAQEPHMAYSVLRAKFDAYLGQRTAAAGALIVPTTTVTDLLKDGRGRVIGVRTNRPDGDLLADVVILADGAVSLLAEAQKMHPKWKANQLAVAVKEVLAPPGNAAERAKSIEQRFGLAAGQGMTIELFGSISKGTVGIGFLYTNKDTISFGLGALLSDVVKLKQNPHEMLQEAKAHPALAPLLADCEPREYMAHMIPEGGYDAVGQVYADGVLVVGDAAQLCNGLHREGSNFAMMSGKLAAETALRAHDRGDFSVNTLRAYESKLRDSFIMKDLKKYRDASHYMESNRRMLGYYPGLVNRMATEFFTVDSVPKRAKQWKLLRMVDNPIRAALDGIGMGWRLK